MKKTALITILVLGLMCAQTVGAQAATKLTLTPASGTFTNGSNFTVTVGIDSGTDKVYTSDLWMVFDASKIEFVDAVAVGSPAFPMQLGQKNFDNVAGTFNIALMPTSATTNLAEVAKGDLVTLTFKAKNTGTASLGFSCAAGNTSDTNVFSPDLADVVNCASNQSGSYTIQAGVGGETTVAATPTPKASTLPKTGGFAPTLSLVVVGIIGMIASAFFLL
jgi:hypothetical protein